jgi:high frequency lysogenization protein
MKHTLTESTIALAGIYQATSLVREIAQHGHAIKPACKATIHSIFTLDADNIEDVYGDLEDLYRGLTILVEHLGEERKNKRDMELTRYVLALIFLERKLAKNQPMQEMIRTGVSTAATQAEYFSETHSNVISSLADLYQKSISTLSPRIMVNGEPAILNNQENANLIRALLLAGIRSTVLWRQSGGSRLQLIFKRRQIVQTARGLLATLPEGST